MTVIRWMAAAFNTLAYAFYDGIRWLCGDRVLWRVPRAVAVAGTPVRRVDIGDGREWAETLRTVADHLADTHHLEVVSAASNGGHGALVWDTAEFPIVYVCLERRIPKTVHARVRPVVSLVRTTPRLRCDALGSWDPSTVDWSAPSIYEDVSLDRMSVWGRLVPDEDRFEIAAGIADRVMCGV